MKKTEYYSPLVYIWLVLIPLLLLPTVFNNLSLLIRGWSEGPLRDNLAFLAMVLGPIVYIAGYVLVAMKRKTGIWLIFLSMPVAFVLTALISGISVIKGDDFFGLELYVGIPILASIITAGLLFIRHKGELGWNVLLRRNVLPVLVALLILLPSDAFAQDYKPYLSQQDVASSLQFLPQPPAPGSVEFAVDEFAYTQAKTLRDTPRGAQAVRDAMMDDTVLLNFEEAFGIRITKETLPKTYELLMRAKECFGSSGCNEAKEGYHRTRPFVYYDEPTLTPDDEPFLRKNYSYPSGHSANFMGLALILASLRPERQTEIFIRAREGGYSRAIVGAHWLSDVQAGQSIAALVYARLQCCDEYNRQYRKARRELKCYLKKQNR